MTDISGIQSLLDNVRYILMIDKPAVVRDLKFNVDFRDHVVDQSIYGRVSSLHMWKQIPIIYKRIYIAMLLPVGTLKP